MIQKKTQIYGYIRVSSRSQEFNSSFSSQKNELINYGVPEKNIYEEIGSGSTVEHRPIFNKLLLKLKEGDEIVVTKLDRCSRSTLDFLSIQENLIAKGVKFKSLDLPEISNDFATNKLIATTLAAIATFENERRKERQAIGIAAAKKKGKYKGRKSVIEADLIKRVKYYKEKNLSVTDISKLTGRSRSTIYKILKIELGYVSNKLIKKNN